MYQVSIRFERGEMIYGVVPVAIGLLLMDR